LLVVISIIALLVSILMPALGAAREQSKSILCKSNLKQLAFASILWSEDNDGFVPPAAWCWDDPFKTPNTPPGEEEPNPGSITEYTDAKRNDLIDDRGDIHNLYHCPSAPKEIKFDPYSIKADYRSNYGINAYITVYIDDVKGRYPGGVINGNPSEVFRGIFGPDWVYWTKHGGAKISNITTASETVFFFDQIYYMSEPGVFNPLRQLEDLPGGYETRWHGKQIDEYGYGKGNYAWVDGHASGEPSDFTHVTMPTFNGERWRYYFYNH
jgi:prepilin-type processing-associated H-X9-DG protein